MCQLQNSICIPESQPACNTQKLRFHIEHVNHELNRWPFPTVFLCQGSLLRISVVVPSKLDECPSRYLSLAMWLSLEIETLWQHIVRPLQQVSMQQQSQTYPINQKYLRFYPLLQSYQIERENRIIDEHTWCMWIHDGCAWDSSKTIRVTRMGLTINSNVAILLSSSNDSPSGIWARAVSFDNNCLISCINSSPLRCRSSAELLNRCSSLTSYKKELSWLPCNQYWLEICLGVHTTQSIYSFYCLHFYHVKCFCFLEFSLY